MSVPTNTESVGNNQRENISLQISENSTRGIQKKHKKLRKGDGSHIFVPSSDSGNNTVISVDSIAGKNDQPLLSKTVTEKNRKANERAVENCMQCIQNIHMVVEDRRIETSIRR